MDIIVPYAGSAALLKETVRSVLAQTDDGWRLVVVEDGPQGAEVRAWLEDLDDPRVEHVLNPINLGVAGNFQRCLDLAISDYVTFLGCDDRLWPGYVAAIRAGLSRHGDVGVIQPGVCVVDADGAPSAPLGDRVKAAISRRVRRGGIVDGEPLLTSLMHGNWAYFPSLCWRRELIARHGFRQDLETVLDLSLLAGIVLDGASLLVLPETLFDYRRHEASVSSRTAISSIRFAEERLVMTEIADAADGLGWSGAARAARWRITSRLHAALLVPRAVLRRDVRAVRALVRHALRDF